MPWDGQARREETPASSRGVGELASVRSQGLDPGLHCSVIEPSDFCLCLLCRHQVGLLAHRHHEEYPGYPPSALVIIVSAAYDSQ